MDVIDNRFSRFKNEMKAFSVCYSFYAVGFYYLVLISFQFTTSLLFL